MDSQQPPVNERYEPCNVGTAVSTTGIIAGSIVGRGRRNMELAKTEIKMIVSKSPMNTGADLLKPQGSLLQAGEERARMGTRPSVQSQSPLPPPQVPITPAAIRTLNSTGTSKLMEALSANRMGRPQSAVAADTSASGVAGKRLERSAFNTRLRFSVWETESAYHYRDTVVKKQDGFTHMLLSTKTTENNALSSVSHNMGPSSLLADQQATLPDSQEIQTNGDAASEYSLMDAEQSDSKDSETENDVPIADEPRESVADVLQCEFCGKRGYAHTFLRSKRFCSMTCIRRFNVSCTKRLSMLRADRAQGRWGHRSMGRRGRPPSRVNGVSRELFLRQTERKREWVEERERDGQEEQTVTETHSSSDREKGDLPDPSQWSVDQVCSYINSLPGCEQVAEAFRSQEIDGQALLLLTEDHLVSTMNLKLGPALKLCAYINSLKES